MGPAYKPPTTPHLSHMSITEGAVQETLSGTESEWGGKCKTGILSEERDGWYVVKTTVHDIFPGVSLSSLEKRKETLFLAPWLWVIMNLKAYFRLSNYVFILWDKNVLVC